MKWIRVFAVKNFHDFILKNLRRHKLLWKLRKFLLANVSALKVVTFSEYILLLDLHRTQQNFFISVWVKQFTTYNTYFLLYFARFLNQERCLVSLPFFDITWPCLSGTARATCVNIETITSQKRIWDPLKHQGRNFFDWNQLNISAKKGSNKVKVSQTVKADLNS